MGRRASGLGIAFALFLGLFVTVVPSGAGGATSSDRVRADASYRADFSESRTRGVGLRFVHLASGEYVDLRLKGYGGTDPSERAGREEFTAGKGIRLVYEPAGDSVKESIVLDQNAPAEFRFALGAPNALPKKEGKDIVLTSPDHPPLFRLQEVTAWDSTGREIPASLALETSARGDPEVVLRLDHKALADAVPPITIDPTIQGAAPSATAEPYTRKLFRTSDGRIVFFYPRVTGTNPQTTTVEYRVSSDGGTTWSGATAIAQSDVNETLSGLAVTQGPDDAFYVAYSFAYWDGRGGEVRFRRLIPSQGGTWTAGLESVIAPLTPTVIRWMVSIADWGESPLGRRLALGYASWGGQYVVHLSEDGGQSWGAATPCTDVGSPPFAMLAAAGDRLFCIASPDAGVGELRYRTWSGVSWSPQVGWTPLTGLILPQAGQPWTPHFPSAVATSDGTLHLVGSAPDGATTRYVNVPASGSLSGPVTLGPGQTPVISASGTNLYAYAFTPVAWGESWIRPYAALGGGSWQADSPFSGRTFTGVLDYNAAWAFEDRAGDALFALTDSQGTVGNEVGTVSAPHRIDDAGDKVSFSFQTPSAGGHITQVKLWATVSGSGNYMVGIQTDNGSGSPSGTWKSWWTWQPWPPTSLPKQFTVGIPDTGELGANTRYHVVIQPNGSLSSGNQIDVWAVGVTDAAAQATPLKVLEKTTQSLWTLVTGELPRFQLLQNSSTLVTQQVAPVPPLPVTAYSIPGESFVAPRAMTPSQAKLYMVKVGNPTGSLTLRLLGATNTELWSAQATPSAEGWLSASVSGVTLAAGSRYRLLVESTGRDTANYWGLGISGDAAESWDATTSVATRAFDRPGFNERTAEASDTGASALDFVAFNSAPSDLLYLGDARPFDFVSFTRAVTDPGSALPSVWSYWNGSAWSTLQVASHGADLEFTPPPDWVKNTVNERNAYWVRLGSTSSGPTPVHVQRVTSILNLASPTLPPSASAPLPLAYVDLGAGEIRFLLHQLDRLAPPAIAGLAAGPLKFSPNADGAQDTTTFSATLSDDSPPITWKLEVWDMYQMIVLKSWSGSLTGSTGALNVVWDGKTSSGASVPDWEYQVVLTATDDWGNSASGSILVLIDTLPPVLTALAPLDTGNVLARSQPIVVGADDLLTKDTPTPGARVDPASLTEVVRDQGGSLPEQRPAVRFEQGVFRSDPVNVAAGVTYQVTTTARDFAGNQTTLTSTFFGMNSASIAAASASVQSLRSSSRQPGGPLETNDLYVWDDVQSIFGSFDVSLNSTNHKGTGVAHFTVPLTDAQVTYTVGGGPGVPVHPDQQSALAKIPFSVPQTGSVTITAPGQTASIGRITAHVPKGADPDSIRLSLQSSASGSFSICADPSASSTPCSVDPVSAFEITLNGIDLIAPDPFLRGPVPRSGLLGSCAPEDIHEMSEAEVRASPYFTTPNYLPPYTQEFQAPQGIRCGQAVGLITRQFVDDKEELIGITRFIGTQSVSFPAPVANISAGQVNGKPSIFIAPSTPDGEGNSAILISESYGVTQVAALGLPFSELLRVAQGVA